MDERICRSACRWLITVLNNVINMWIQRLCTIQSNAQNLKAIWNQNTAASQSYCRWPCSRLHCKSLDVPKYATADLLGLSSSPLSQNQYCNDLTQPCKLSKAVANGTVILVKICISSAYWWYSTPWLAIKRPLGLTSQYSAVVLTVVRVMIAKYRKSGIWGYRSSLTPEPIELK